MMKNVLKSAVLLSIVASLMLVGSMAEAKTPQVALIMKSLANEFFLTMENGAREHQKANADKYELIANGIKNESDIAQQIKIVEQMIARRVDAIIIAPADSKALLAVCKKALNEGIVVINIDNKFDDDAMKEQGIKLPFVGPNNQTGAKKVGDYLAKFLEKGDKVAIIEGIPTAFNAQQRTQGFTESMTEIGADIVSSQTAEWDMAKANTVASAIISENPDLKALLCDNDSMALGAVAAVKAAGKTGDIHVVGFDNISAVQEMLKDGRILATADQYAADLAVFGIEYALEMLETGAAPENKETPVDLITKDNVK